MGDYKVTIGLEIHAELKTKTKMFCDSKNDPEEIEPNINICPVCMAHPGTLPVINKEAVKHVLKMGLAVGGNLADFTEFDRKNYFYPDIPKGSQISQYKYPLISGGNLAGVDITRIHLEEDTAKSTHDGGNESLVDFNRAGLPLMELVTEPVIHDAKKAVEFARALQLLLRYLGAGDANMEKGEMRVEANISVSKTKEFGTKVEVKNLNSFKAVERATEYEIKRHIELIESGGEVVQETRGWNESTQETFSQRLKENSEEYRYFPDPDLPKLKISEIEEFSTENLKKELPELPDQKREKLAKWGIKAKDIEVIVNEPVLLCSYVEEVSKELNEDKKLIQLASNYIVSDILGIYKEKSLPNEINIESKNFAKLIKMADGGDLSSRGVKDILRIMIEKGDGDPEEIAEKHNLVQKSDEGELKTTVLAIIENNKSVAEEYKSGKETALKFLVGQGMKETRGSANPQVLEKLLKSELKK
jgi:aspartyl-tRNA(Asn)/glutamyl-tRNA(Gln) amidotransferase subunit B